MENYIFTREFRRLHARTLRYEAVKLRRAVGGLNREIVAAIPAGILRRFVRAFLYRGRKRSK